MQSSTDPLLTAITGELEFDVDDLRRRYREERDRRTRAEGNAQYVKAEGRFARYADDPWVRGPRTRPPVRDHHTAIVLGGGWGGLLVGARLAERGVDDVRIIEIAGDFGGTWYWNRYPGAMCDIEAHIYLPLLEELDYSPKHRYSYGPELLAHAQRIGREYGLYDEALFQTQITAATWDDATGTWRVETDHGDELTADFLVLAGGRQSRPKLPGIPGLDEFRGHIFHTSRWDYDYTGGDQAGELSGLRSRRVGVVGTGATALQVVPAVAKDARQLLVFQRTPSTVAPRGNVPTGPDHVRDRSPGWQGRRQRNFQSLCRFSSLTGGDPPDVDDVGDAWTDLFGKLVDLDLDRAREVLGRDPTDGEVAYLAEIADFRVMNEIRARVDDVVDDPATAELLKPWYRWQCKRPGFHDEYLESFNRPNVTLVDASRGGIERFTPNGVVVDGTEHPIDCLIMATGFEAGISYTRLIGFDPVGVDGVRLGDHWSEGVRTFQGMMTDHFPNLLLVGSNPQTAAAVNAVQLLDEHAHHTAYVISETRARGVKSVVPTPSSVDSYVTMITENPQVHAMLEFYQECTPGYYNAEGHAATGAELFLGARYPDGPIAYYEYLAQWRDADEFEGVRLR